MGNFLQVLGTAGALQRRGNPSLVPPSETQNHSAIFFMSLEDSDGEKERRGGKGRGVGGTSARKLIGQLSAII